MVKNFSGAILTPIRLKMLLTPLACTKYVIVLHERTLPVFKSITN